MTIGQRNLRDLISDYRKAHGLSQRQFAAQCGLSNGYISMLEKGLNPNTGLPITPTFSKLKQLAIGMDLSLTDLLAKVDDILVDSVSNSSESNDCLPATENELDSRIMETVSNLSVEKKKQALSYVQFLAQSEL